MTLHTGTENSPIVVLLSVKKYKTDILSFSLGVTMHEILDKIGKIAPVISCEISWDLLNDTTISEILLKIPVSVVNKHFS